MKKKLNTALAFLFLATYSLSAKSIDIVTKTEVYSVPLKYVDQYDKISSDGKLISTKIQINQEKNVFKSGNTIVIFPSDNKYKNMNILIGVIEDYAKKLDNIDINKVKRVLNILKIESPK